MTKPRKKRADSEIWKEFEELERRIEQHKLELEETFKMAAEARRRLRLIYEGR